MTTIGLDQLGRPRKFKGRKVIIINALSKFTDKSVREIAQASRD